MECIRSLHILLSSSFSVQHGAAPEYLSVELTRLHASLLLLLVIDRDGYCAQSKVDLAQRWSSESISTGGIPVRLHAVDSINLPESRCSG